MSELGIFRELDNKRITQNLKTSEKRLSSILDIYINTNKIIYAIFGQFESNNYYKKEIIF